MYDLPIIFEGANYNATVTIKTRDTGLPIPFPGTTEVTLYKTGNAIPFVTATVANGKLTSVNTTTGVIVFNLNAVTDLADTGGGYGSIQVRRSDVPTIWVVYQVRFMEAGDLVPVDYNGTVLVQLAQVTVETAATVSPSIPPGSITNTYLAPMASNTVKANLTGLPAVPGDVTLDALKTALNFDEAAQDAVGAMVDASLNYVDATNLLQRAALTGAITASAGSNATSLGTFTLAQLNTAVNDGDVSSTTHIHADVIAAGAAGFMTGADKTKLNGIATAATANSTDATLLSRANHTGTQLVATISDFSSHIHADVIAAGAAGFMTGADKTKLNGIATAATANSTDATLLGRANHTGTQLAATISDFSAAADARIVLAETDFEKGTRALVGMGLSTNQIGTKALLVDVVRGGYASIDPTATTDLGAIEVYPSITLTNSTGGNRISRKRKIEVIGANALRYTHGLDGRTIGALMEPSHAYLNKYSQPTVAQIASSSNASDFAAPTGETGNWIGVTTIGTLAFFYDQITPTSGTIYYARFEVIMDDGTAPVVSTSSTTGDFIIVMQGSISGILNPDTGASGARVTGPFAGAKYVVDGYYTASVSVLSNFGIAKYAAQSAKNFKIGRRNYGPGRYPPSFFDNATATANTRSGDLLRLPISGFTVEGGLTIGVEFTYTGPLSVSGRLVSAGTSVMHLNIFESSGTGGINAYYWDNIVSRIITLTTAANLVLGTTYRAYVAIDPINGIIRGKITGVTAPAEITTVPTSTSLTCTTLGIGNFLGSSGNQPGVPISRAFVIDRPWTALEGSAFTG